MNTIMQAREELAADLKQKQDAVSKAQDRLTKFDELFNEATPAPRKKPGPKPKAEKALETTTPKPRGKPGPKPKNKPVVETATPKPRGKPGPKPKGDKALKTETVKTAGKSRAAEGRRAVARGERPPIKQAMAQVMGSDVCNPAMVAERLAAKGWTPSASNPKTYVGYMLSSSKDMFDRVPAKGRGYYKVKASAVTTAETSSAPEEKSSPKATSKAANGVGKPSTDEILKEAGFDALAGPFGG